MIFYFTGTGNSYHAAKSISQYSGETLVSIAEEMKKGEVEFEYTLKEYEGIGFVYPVYAWAPPKIMMNFIQRIKLKNFKGNYVFSVAICGDNVGNTMKVLGKGLKKKGIQLHSGFSILMPNNYIILGNVDSRELEKEKLSKAEERLRQINEIVASREKGVFELEKGPAPWFLTGCINPVFTGIGMNTKKFYATDSCTGCGLCERVCSAGSIKVDKRPSWGSECTQCLACIHRCPVKAIQYGKGTVKKGRYKHPDME